MTVSAARAQTLLCIQRTVKSIFAQGSVENCPIGDNGGKETENGKFKIKENPPRIVTSIEGIEKCQDLNKISELKSRAG